MFWVYTMWIFVLFGLEVSAIVQVLRGRSPAVLNRGEGTPGMIEPSIVLRVLQEAGRAFDDGTPVEVDQVANQLGLPVASTRVIIERLADRGVLVRLQTTDQFALSRPWRRSRPERSWTSVSILPMRAPDHLLRPCWTSSERFSATCWKA